MGYSYDNTVSIMYMIRDNLSLWAKADNPDEHDDEDDDEDDDDDSTVRPRRLLPARCSAKHVCVCVSSVAVVDLAVYWLPAVTPAFREGFPPLRYPCIIVF